MINFRTKTQWKCTTKISYGYRSSMILTNKYLETISIYTITNKILRYL